MCSTRAALGVVRVGIVSDKEKTPTQRTGVYRKTIAFNCLGALPMEHRLVAET